MCNLFSNLKGIKVLELNGNCPYHKKNQLLKPEEFTPKKMCPLLLHSIIPYYLTLKNNGWFKWVKDDVLVRCPNPECNAILSIKKDKKVIVIKIKDIKNKCEYNHNKEDTVKLTDKDFFLCPKAFNSLYPYLLLLKEGIDIPWKNPNNKIIVRCPSNSNKVIYEVITKNPIKQQENTGCLSYNNLELKTKHTKIKCRYHPKKNHLHKYNFNNLSPKNLCIDAYHTLYPYALALLYDAKFINSKEKETIYLRCPNPNGVIIKVKRKPILPKPIIYIKEMAHLFLKKIEHPIDAPFDYKIEISINDEGHCPKHKKGDKYRFNLWSSKELCPASSHAIFPYIILLSKNKCLPWKKEKGVGEVFCPDHRGFTYKINTKKKPI